jgi:S-adenosylmethionine:tRNA ribosyltransferase-isomerase
LGARSQLRIVDAILSGTHEMGTSHFELLRAFASAAVLNRADSELAAHGYRTHEFGDSILIERERSCCCQGAEGCGARTTQEQSCRQGRVSLATA